MRHRVRRMRWRIAGAYIVLIVLTLALLSLALLQLLRRTYLQTLEAGLAGQAWLVATIADTQAAAAAPAQRDACRTITPTSAFQPMRRCSYLDTM